MTKKKTIPKFLIGILSLEDLTTVANTITEAEKKTSGEIRISLREKRHRKEKKMNLFSLAHQEFHKLGMEKTHDHTGILLYFLFEDRGFQILADKGIYAKIPQTTWDKIAEDISLHLKQGNFCKGICHGIEECSKLLSREFPIKPDDINEIPNDVSIS